jgi:HK97 gp10 family phage protein
MIAMLVIKVDFQSEALKKIPLISPALHKNLNTVIKKAALNIQATAKKNMRKPGRGRLYARYRGGRSPILHRASAPGDYPATDTGRLLSSIATDFSDLTAEIGSHVNYSGFLEAGTSKMQARPWLLPSLKENEKSIEAMIDQAINESMK